MIEFHGQQVIGFQFSLVIGSVHSRKYRRVLDTSRKEAVYTDTKNGAVVGI
jgi:hypothetical protein